MSEASKKYEETLQRLEAELDNRAYDNEKLHGATTALIDNNLNFARERLIEEEAKPEQTGPNQEKLAAAEKDGGKTTPAKWDDEIKKREEEIKKLEGQQKLEDQRYKAETETINQKRNDVADLVRTHEGEIAQLREPKVREEKQQETGNTWNRVMTGAYRLSQPPGVPDDVWQGLGEATKVTYEHAKVITTAYMPDVVRESIQAATEYVQVQSSKEIDKLARETPNTEVAEQQNRVWDDVRSADANEWDKIRKDLDLHQQQTGELDDWKAGWELRQAELDKQTANLNPKARKEAETKEFNTATEDLNKLLAEHDSQKQESNAKHNALGEVVLGEQNRIREILDYDMAGRRFDLTQEVCRDQAERAAHSNGQPLPPAEKSLQEILDPRSEADHVKRVTAVLHEQTFPETHRNGQAQEELIEKQTKQLDQHLQDLERDANARREAEGRDR